MADLDMICAWKDEESRLSLSGAEKALQPAHSTEFIELTDAQLDAATGGSCMYFPPVGPPTPCSLLESESPGVLDVVWGFLSGVVEYVGNNWYLKP